MKKANRLTVIFIIVGILLGIPFSYYLQPDIVQVKLSLGEYLKNFLNVVTDDSGDFLTPVFLSCLIGAIIGGIVGNLMDRKRSDSSNKE